HIDIDYLLDNERHPDLLSDVYRLKSPMPGGPEKVDVRCYYEPGYHAREVESIWKRTWQMACREDDIPKVGDHHVYEIAHLSFLVVRTGEDTFKAHYNACLHRGRKLKECDGRNAKVLRCPYHGWSWNIDGSLKEIPAEWDFTGVRESVSQLPSAQVASWGGFIFINPDPDAQPLEEFLGPVMIAHYQKFKLQNRFKQAHVQKTIRANWKVVMEAFMESYHVIATHPQQVFLTGDMANTPYDVFGNWGRADHILGGINRGSPMRGIFPDKDEALAVYQSAADNARGFLRTLIGDEVDAYSDADLNSEASFNDLFPNLHPWGGFARVVFRFRPNGNNPDECLFDVMLLGPWPEGKAKPEPAPLRVLSVDEPWTDAPELFMLAKILDQDVGNVTRVQEGLRALKDPYVWLSAYQEGKIRNFHRNYREALATAAPGSESMLARSQ
ncbi:MAG TPA: aromatic ring-hydroxylating dioxygenase subunit alpha, partial [Pseudomonas sp.]|nr:aromatic ring-hydroxylating dioxygenase subunit alpha [Pseudomonas sp.]